MSTYNAQLPNVLKTVAGDLVTTPQEWVKRREEIKNLLITQFLGTYPDQVSMTYEVIEEGETLGGKANCQKIQIHLGSGTHETDFSFQLIFSQRERPAFIILHLDFTEQYPAITEELIDEGFGLAHVNYNDIEKDISEERFDGIQGLCPERSGSRWGKIGCWAFGASRIVDVLKGHLHAEHIILAGHSRLAMTALWAGAMDERIDVIAAINSGGLYRGTQAETFHDLSREYTKYWFCHDLFLNYQTEEELPFDMHFVLALIAPRLIFLDGATRDQWCDPYALYACGKAVSPVYQTLGLSGLEGPDRPAVEQAYFAGQIGYYLREGTHCFGRDDWHQLIRFVREHA